MLLQTKGLVNAAGLMMLDFGPKEPVEEWHERNVHNKLLGLCLASSSSSKAGYSVLASCSTKTDLRVYSSSGRWECGAWGVAASERAGRQALALLRVDQAGLLAAAMAAGAAYTARGPWLCCSP